MPFEFFKRKNPIIKEGAEEKIQEPILIGKNPAEDGKNALPEDLTGHDKSQEDYLEILNANALAEEGVSRPKLSHTEKDQKTIENIKAPNPDLN